jgi:hypothetical protein
MEKEEDTAAGLMADEPLLFGSGGSGEKEARFEGTGRSDKDPALAVDGGVLDKLEAEDAAIPVDGFVVVADDEGDISDVLVHRVFNTRVSL